MMKRLVMLAVALVFATAARGQELSLSTNIAALADLATLNAEGSWGFSRHWSAVAGLNYNPFSYGGGADGGPLQDKQRSAWVGMRWWPWHIFSGWWMSGRARWQEYNRGGVKTAQTSEGDRYGAGLAAGYTVMLSPHFNVDLGAGVWGGFDRHTVYACPTCGRSLSQSEGGFVLPDEILLSLSYVF